jgi:acyl transferase domain-containing protein
MTVTPIAIIGLACRFPGAENADGFRRLLAEGVDAISDVPARRWDADRLYEADIFAPGTMNTRWGGFLSNLDTFDYPRFRLSRREASHMDPQQRLLLETTWEALEDAGILPDAPHDDEVGVFIGIGSVDHASLTFRDAASISAYAITGNGSSLAANRLSHAFGFRGPSVAVDTACSSSLVALHLACQSLLTGEADVAIAGGVNVLLSPTMNLALSQAWMTAADGRCKSFDVRADGWVRSEGCGVVVLRRLEDARRRGDPIRAIVRGSAVNHAGGGHGLTTPSADAQRRVIESALQRAGVRPRDVEYIEAHGVGSAAADAAEAEAICGVFGLDRDPGTRCWLGSVKSNLGNLDWAAGIAGVIKVVIALDTNQIPSHLHLVQPIPPVARAADWLQIPRAPVSWPARTAGRVAGVNSFGFGGTNAHVVIADPPAEARGGRRKTSLRPRPLRRLPCPFASAASHAPSSEGPRAARDHPVVTTVVNVAEGPHVRIAEGSIDATSHRFLTDFRISDVMIVPGASLLEFAAAAAPPTGFDAAEYADVEFLRPLFLPDGGRARLQVTFAREGHEAAFHVFATPVAADNRADWWSLHARGRVRAQTRDQAPFRARTAFQSAAQSMSNAGEFYARHPHRTTGTMRGVDRIWRADGEALTRCVLPDTIVAEAGAYLFHPAAAEICAQAVWDILQGQDSARVVARGMRCVRYHRPTTPVFWVHARITSVERALAVADFSVTDEAGQPLADVRGLVLVPVEGRAYPDVASYVTPPVAAAGPSALVADLAGLSPRDRAEHVAGYLVDFLAGALDRPASSVDREAPLQHLGLDSLLAVDLRAHVARGLRVDVPIAELLAGRSVDDLARLLARRLEPAGGHEPSGRGSIHD